MFALSLGGNRRGMQGDVVICRRRKKTVLAGVFGPEILAECQQQETRKTDIG